MTIRLRRAMVGLALSTLGPAAGEASAGVVLTLDKQLSETVARADGYAATHDFGTVIVGAPNQTTDRFGLKDNGESQTQKNGFGLKVTAAGAATVSPSPTATLPDGGTLALTVGVDTSAVGLRTGTVTVDSKPPGGDADEVYTVKATVLDHSNASFDPLADADMLDFDFGTWFQGGYAQDQLSITNLLTTPGFTASLDLDSITSSTGNTGVLTTNLAPFKNLSAGSSRVFDVLFDLSNLGTFWTSYTLNLSDQDLLGATTRVLTLNLRGEVIARPALAASDPSEPTASDPSVIATPEPSTLVSAGTAVLLGLGYSWRRRKRAAAAWTTAATG